VVLEELMGLPGFVGSIELIIDYPNPRADAGQRPHIKRYIVGGKSFQNPDVQSGRWTTTAERNGSLHHWFLL